MGKPTGRIIRALRNTGRGSDYYGACDRCNKHVSEVFVSQSKREYVRENGEVYYSAIGGGAHGHEACLQSAYGPHEN